MEAASAGRLRHRLSAGVAACGTGAGSVRQVVTQIQFYNQLATRADLCLALSLGCGNVKLFRLARTILSPLSDGFRRADWPRKSEPDFPLDWSLARFVSGLIRGGLSLGFGGRYTKGPVDCQQERVTAAGG